MANVALTTTFTPPASCFDNVYTSYAGSFYEKDISILSSECYPSSFHTLFVEQVPYSPGICPSGYSYDATTPYGDDATAAVCCPIGFTAQGGGQLGCNSDVNAPKELYVDGSTITVDQATLAVHGVYIAWGPNEQPSAGSTAAASSSQAESSTPAAVASSAYVLPSSTPGPEASSSSQSSSDPRPSSSSASPTGSSSSAAGPTSSSLSTSKVTAPLNPHPSSHTTSPTTPTASDSPSTLHPAHSGLTTGAKAGIGVGVAVGVAAIAMAALFFVWRRRRRPTENDMYQQPELLEKRDPEAANKAHHISELSTEGGRSELSGASPFLDGQSKGGPMEIDSR